MTTASLPYAIVVDDEISYLQLLEAILEETLACPVKTFPRAKEALAALPDMDVGIIVTDFSMPEMDGMEFLKKAEMIKPDVLAIIISEHKPFLDGLHKSQLHQLQSVMAKPFRINELAQEITRLWPEAISRAES